MYTLTTFQEEKLKEFLPSWCDIMSDRNIPQYVRGVNFHLWEGFPLARELPSQVYSVSSNIISLNLKFKPFLKRRLSRNLVLDQVNLFFLRSRVIDLFE